MTELKVVLQFVCSACEEAVSVTVKCEGKGLAHGSLANVKVPCPGCGTMHRLDFEANGFVHAVSPYRSPRMLFEPSIN